MATTIRQAILSRISDQEKEIEQLLETIKATPRKLLDIEADNVGFWAGDRWFRMRDKSHPGLCADLMEMGLKPICSGRKKATSDGMMAEFCLSPSGERNKHIFVDVIRPGGNCQTVRVRVTDERVISVCGDLPSNYEVMEVLDEKP